MCLPTSVCLCVCARCALREHYASAHRARPMCVMFVHAQRMCVFVLSHKQRSKRPLFQCAECELCERVSRAYRPTNIQVAASMLFLFRDQMVRFIYRTCARSHVACVCFPYMVYVICIRYSIHLLRMRWSGQQQRRSDGVCWSCKALVVKIINVIAPLVRSGIE